MSKGEIPDLDKAAFEKGRQFIDGICEGLQTFDGYPGIAKPGNGYPSADKILVEIKPQPGQRLFFNFVDCLTRVETEEIGPDGYRRIRQRLNIWGLGITEAKKVVIEHSPRPSTEAVLYTPFEQTDQVWLEEYGLVAARAIFRVRELGRLNLALAYKNTQS